MINPSDTTLANPALAKKILFIINPLAGKGHIRNKALQIIDNFVKNGYEVTVHTTQSKDDAHNIVLAKHSCYGRIVVSGGDGTLSQVIASLMQVKQKPLLGYIPAGTTNDFATALKIPKDPIKAGLTAINGWAFPCDIGSFNQQFFDYVAAFGIITNVTYETPQNIKNSLGYLAYILELLKTVHQLTAHQLTVECNGEIISGQFIFGMITNTSIIGGIKSPLSKLVSTNDGLFEVILIKKPKNVGDIQQIINSTLQKNVESGAMITLQTPSIKITCDTEIPWNLDGDFGGSHQTVLINNCHNAITMMISKDHKVLLPK